MALIRITFPSILREYVCVRMCVSADVGVGVLHATYMIIKR